MVSALRYVVATIFGHHQVVRIQSLSTLLFSLHWPMFAAGRMSCLHCRFLVVDLNKYCKIYKPLS
jgi:hypothetical protein